MREHWIDEHVGGEASVRPEFEAELGEALQSGWRQPIGSGVARRPSGPSRRIQVLIWAAAAAVLVVGGAVVLTQTGKSQVTSNTGEITVPATAAPTPATSAPPQTAAPSTSAVSTSTSELPATTLASVVATTPEQQTVLDYLTALAERRYGDAAKLLGEGGLSIEDRSDLRPLLNADGLIPDLAASLKAWCEQRAICIVPTALRGDDSHVTATFSIDGVERSATFVGATFEGYPLVHGLPLQLPAGVSLADTVPCPTELVDDTAYADLNGDGWYETVTLTPGLGGGNLITACGTTLQTPNYEWPLSEAVGAATRRLLPLDIEGDGRDELLAGQYLLDTAQSSEFVASVVRLGEVGLESAGQSVGLNPSAGLYMDKPTSFGCTDLDGDGVRDLVSYAYSYVGGTDISNSTALSYTASFGTMSKAGSLDLPAQSDEAFRLISGYCGNFPTQTG